jgi:hypothetical protein
VSACGDGASGTRSRRRPTGSRIETARASGVGGPPRFGPVIYKQRHAGKYEINRLKRHPATVIRYDKFEVCYEAIRRDRSDQ